MKIWLLFLFLPSLVFGSYFSSIPPTVQTEVSLLWRYPETNKFVKKVLKEGPIALQWIPLGEEHAYWSAEKRVIALNSSRPWEEGEKIYSILFELHNADATTAFNNLDIKASKNRLSKAYYVETVERLEYNNLLKTSKLLEAGVRKGYFPSSTYIPDCPPFQEHFQLQKRYGHSRFIANKYDLLINHPLPRYLR